MFKKTDLRSKLDNSQFTLTTTIDLPSTLLEMTRPVDPGYGRPESIHLCVFRKYMGQIDWYGHEHIHLIIKLTIIFKYMFTIYFLNHRTNTSNWELEIDQNPQICVSSQLHNDHTTVGFLHR